MSIVAISVFQNRVSSRLDCAERFLLVNCEGGSVCRREELLLSGCSLMEKVRILMHKKVDVLICGGLTDLCDCMLRNTGIEVIPWVRGDVEETLGRFQQGILHSNYKPTGSGYHHA
jgi:predicted Fe-Mo cluster-binding NifX family protein